MANLNGRTDTKTVVGYIGLGNAGYPLASTLSRAGYYMVVQDADPQRAHRFAEEFDNARAATGDMDDFSQVDVLVTMLPNGEIVRDVLLGARGVAKVLKDKAVIIDTSSSSPFHTRETGQLLHEQNPTLTLIDSPITQEYAFALAKGDATLMVGCSDEAALEIAMPILKTMGKHVFVMGELGAGHAMKTLNNYTSAASILGLCDALIAGQKFGLDPAKMVDVMNVGTGVNFSTKESFRTDVSQRSNAMQTIIVQIDADCNAIGSHSPLPVRVPALASGEGYENREVRDRVHGRTFIITRPHRRIIIGSRQGRRPRRRPHAMH